MAPKKKAKHTPNPKRKRGSAHPKTARSAPLKKLCDCEHLALINTAKDVHLNGRHETLTGTSSTAFITIRLSQRIVSEVLQRKLELTTQAALHFHTRNPATVIEKGVALLQQQTEVSSFQEPNSGLLERKQQREQKLNRTGFLTFKYGQSVEARNTIGAWPSHLIVSPNTKIPRLTGLLTTSDQSAPARTRLTRQLSQTETRQEGVQPGHRSEKKPNLSIRVPIAFSSPVSFNSLFPLTPADSRRQSLIDSLVSAPVISSPSNFLAMSSQQANDATGGVEPAIKEVIQSLFSVQQHVSGFRLEHQERLNQQIEEVAQNLNHLEGVVSKLDNPLHNVTVAPEIIDYVEDGRNPDIFTRDFVELVQRGNSVMNGKQKAFHDFSKVFAKALKDNFDGMDEEIDMIMDDAGMTEKDGKYVEKMIQNGNGA